VRLAEHLIVEGCLINGSLDRRSGRAQSAQGMGRRRSSVSTTPVPWVQTRSAQPR
jgi:hypothetical protein